MSTTRRLVVAALVLLASPLWPLGFVSAIAYAAFMGGWGVAMRTMEEMDAE